MTDLGFVHRFVPAPTPGAGVTLVLLHGTGGNEEDLIPVGRALCPSCALLSPRGQVLANGMPRFFKRMAEGVFDVDDLKARTHELERFLKAAIREYHLPDTLVAVGYSNGANIAASLMLLHPDALNGAVLFRAMVPFDPEFTPNLSHARVLLAAGNHDPIATPQQTRRLSAILETAGASVALHWHEGGHELGQDDIDAARQWLDHMF